MAIGAVALGSVAMGCGAAQGGQLDRSHYGPAPGPPPRSQVGMSPRPLPDATPPPPSPPAAVSQTVVLPPPPAAPDQARTLQAQDGAPPPSEPTPEPASENASAAKDAAAGSEAPEAAQGEPLSAAAAVAANEAEAADADAAPAQSPTMELPEPSPLLDKGAGPPREPELVVREAPPEPLHETRPPAPGPDHMWAPGYWHYGAAGFHWMPGFWTPMMMGYRFGPPIWSYHGGLWHFYSPIWIPQRWDNGWNRSYYNSNRVYRSPNYGARGYDGGYGRGRGAVRSDARGRAGRRPGSAPPNVRVSPRGSSNPSGRVGSPSRASPSRGGMRGGGSSVRVRAR